MKLLHMADLHLGKRVNDYPMLADQRIILKDILAIGEAHQIDGLLLAGDIYDKALPSAEAVDLLDSFLTSCQKNAWQVMGISGNHDSAERIGFGADIMSHQGIHLSKPYQGKLERVRLTDEFGECNIYLLPFIKPLHVRMYHPNIEVGSYDDAVRTVIEQAQINQQERNILVAHQFVTSQGKKPEPSESEVLSVGGVDNIDVSVFGPFDYVALGHIHRPQKMGRDTVRYSGSILKYSFSEKDHQKSVTILEMKEKNNVKMTLVPLNPPNDMIEIKGPIDQLLDPVYYQTLDTEAYAHIILTDETVMDAIGKLRMVYPNIMRLEFADTLDYHKNLKITTIDIEGSTSLQLFEDFYNLQNTRPLDEEKRKIIDSLLTQNGGLL